MKGINKIRSYTINLTDVKKASYLLRSLSLIIASIQYSTIQRDRVSEKDTKSLTKT